MNIYKRRPEYHEMVGSLFGNTTNKGNESINPTVAKTVTFQVTDDCNLKCSYCYQINKGHRKMSFETAKKFIDLLISGEKGFEEYFYSSKTPGIILDFIGGEPMIEYELLDSIMDYFQYKMITLNHHWKSTWRGSISTNGTLYNDDIKSFLRKHHMHISYSVSLDGNKELHDSCRVFPDGGGSYDLAYRTIRDRLDNNYIMGTKITIAHDNLPFLYDAIKHMYDIGFKEVNANCVYENVWENGDPLLFYDQSKKIADYLLSNNNFSTKDCTLFDKTFFIPQEETDLTNWCGGVGMMIACDPDGWLYPCLRYMESSVGTDVTPFRIGHVDKGIGYTEEYKQRIHCMHCVDRKTQSTDECFYCPISKGCAWCSGYNYQCTGTPDKKVTYICEMHKARALANIYYWNKLYKLNNLDDRMKCWVPKEWALNIIDEDEYNMLLELSDSKPMTIEEAYIKSKEFAKV